jgi:hypothetical protein
MERPKRYRPRNIQKRVVNDFDMAHFLGRSAARARRDYNVEWGFDPIQLDKKVRG